MTSLRFLTAVYTVTALSLAAAPAWAQGYSGLIAPDTAAPQNAAPAPSAQDGSSHFLAPAPAAPAQRPASPARKSAPPAASSAYDGVLAPAPKNATPKAKAAKTPETPGYGGLIAGQLPDSAPDVLRPATPVIAAEDTPQQGGIAQTQIPAGMAAAASTQKYARAAAALTAVPKAYRSTDAMDARQIKQSTFFSKLRSMPLTPNKHPLPQGVADMLTKSTLDKNGKSVTERRIDYLVTQEMRNVEATGLSPEERRLRARAAYEKLLDNGDGIIALSQSTGPMLAKYGLPQSSIDERVQSRDRALRTLQGALHKLKDMQ